jgi:isoamylase
MSRTNAQQMQKRGFPLPAGVTLLKEGINFAVFSRHATRVTLVIDFTPPGKRKSLRVEFELDPQENRTGDMWHILLKSDQQNFSYGYRMDGPDNPDKTGLIFDYNTILIDPFSRLLMPRPWGEKSQYGEIPCCSILNHEFDWKNDRPLKTDLSETIIYELHVRGFTRDASSQVSSPGTYRGIIEKIPYLKKLGITAVELMPVTEFDENDIPFLDPVSGQHLKNFWGYNPVSFFALNSGYGSDPVEVIEEFKSMVLALHQAGIEVYLDMVYNHSGEGGYEGVTSSYRGIDNPIFYLLDKDYRYLNFSGCGNTMNCNHPVVRDLIRESLRYWVTEMHIDGFRFDLASILGRDQDGNVLSNPPMLEVIAEDPVLRDTKMIAEAWDAAGLYQVGSFSTDSRWAEWNGRFRDDIRSFAVGKDNSITHLATRIAGSSDLYQSDSRGPLCSINFITSHDGFTLYDLVSYNDKHNSANGEDNRDGENHNISWNSGHEGVTSSVDINQLRFRRMRSLAVLLLLSQGVPMITAGDEFARTQKGNNNSWCQDNETSWLDWSLLDTHHDYLHFFQKCIQLRKSHKVFRRDQFFSSTNLHNQENSPGGITWQYLKPGEQNWNPDCHGLAFLLCGDCEDQKDSDFFIMLNGNTSESLHFTPPSVPSDEKSVHWHRIIDTAAPPPGDFTESGMIIPADKAIEVQPFGIVVLQAR